MATYEEFEVINRVMSIAYPRFERNAETTILYYQYLKDLPADALKAAADTLITTNTFFPSISEWRQAALDITCAKNNVPTAIEAWEEAVKECNRCGDYWRYQEGKKYPEYTHPLIESCVSAIGYAQILETENVDIVRAHFLKAYESLRQRRDIDQRTLPDVKQVEQKYIASGIKQLAEGMQK